MNAVVMIVMGIVALVASAAFERWGTRRSQTPVNWLIAGPVMAFLFVGGLTLIGFGVVETLEIGQTAPKSAPEITLPSAGELRDEAPVYRQPVVINIPFSPLDIGRGFLFAELVDDSSYNEKSQWAALKRGRRFPQVEWGNAPGFAPGGGIAPTFLLPVNELRRPSDTRYWIRFGLAVPRPWSSISRASGNLMDVLFNAIGRQVELYSGNLWLKVKNDEFAFVEWTRFSPFWVTASAN